MEPFNGNPGLDDEVYICGEACEFNSYSAVFSDEGTIADGDLSEWIRGTNWGLYAKLRRMPLTSSGELVEALKVDPERTSIPIINTGDPRANPRIRQAYKQSGPGSRSGTRDNRLQQPTGSQGDIQKNKSPHLQTLRSSMIGEFYRIFLLGYTLTQNRAQGLFATSPFKPRSCVLLLSPHLST